MSDGNFDLILQELLHQREIMEILEAENRELRQQLADLREGRGIFVEIDGSRFALISPAGQLPTPVESLPTAQIAVVTAEQEEMPVSVAQDVDADQQSLAEETEQVVPETPLTLSEMPPTMNFLLEDDEPATAFFLQESIEEEASAIATSKMAIWGESPSTPFPPISAPQPPAEASTEPIQKPVPGKPQQSPAPIDEDEKAALRRELIGSFLLE